jgi:hypothetical protein
LSKEELVVEVNYRPESREILSKEETENLILQVCRKCDNFEALLPENTKCEVTFKNFEKNVYKTGQSDFKLEPKKLEELQVAYRFYVEYYV